MLIKNSNKHMDDPFNNESCGELKYLVITINQRHSLKIEQNKSILSLLLIIIYI